MIPLKTIATIGARLNPEELTREKGFSRMARNKRQYGSGCLLRKGKGWAIRWRELEIAPDGKTRRVLRYESIGAVSSREASQAPAGHHANAQARAARRIGQGRSLGAGGAQATRLDGSEDRPTLDRVMARVAHDAGPDSFVLKAS